VNFDVRDPLLGGVSGFGYDPGDQRSDRYSYFSSPDEGGFKGAVIEFRLHHVK
jgi:hypothetical protein